MIIRILLIIALFTCSFETVFSQDIYPAKNIADLKRTADNYLYKGKIYHINKSMILRARIYGHSAIQFTTIVLYHKIQLRAYTYFNIPAGNFTKAISLRLTI